MKRISNLLMCALTACAVGVPAVAQSPLAVRWEMGRNGQEGGYSSRFIFKNVSDYQLGSNWQFYFNQFSRRVTLPADCPVDVKEVSTSYYQVTPNRRYMPLAPGDSLVLDLVMRGTMVNVSYQPMGGHVVFDGDTRHPLPVAIDHALLDAPGQWQDHKCYPDGPYVYAQNERVNNVGDAYTGNDYDIFPTPKEVTVSNGYTTVGGLVTVKGGGLFAGKGMKRAKNYLLRELEGRGIYATGGQKTTIQLKIDKKAGANPEGYTLDVNDGRIVIAGAADEGLINGVKTLVAALDHSKGHRLQNVHVADAPDLHYRGYMLDIARNFIGFDDLKRFVDILAYYKINRWQFHFTDDEAWRVEIPGLPELTEVASRRGCTLDEKGYLAQIFDGNGNPDDRTQSANGYLTRSQFVQLLKYAHERGVKLIPEVETPGHARAAIVAMKNRYDRYIGSNPALAEQYKLWDEKSTSQYTSAQSYHDNVLNVAQEGVYRFVEKVVSELQLMYKDAGLKLDIVHLGGDEVASGAWDQAPDVQALMQRHGLKNAHQVNEYYVRRVTDMLTARGIKFEGWQEVALDHDKAFNDVVAPRVAGVNAWSTIGSRDVVPYRLANDGYPVILSNVTNFYMDMAYSWHQYERGLHWGGKVDELDAWSALPWNIYASARLTWEGDSLNAATAHEGKVRLEKPQNIIGVQSQLWAETVRDFDQVLDYTLPKVLGMVERGWNANPEWAGKLADTQAYEEARHQFNLKVGARELPVLKAKGYYFHIGQPGLKVVNGQLLANAQYPGVVVRYTLDGSEPTVMSPQWTAPVALAGGQPPVIKARAYYLGHESVTTYLFKK